MLKQASLFQAYDDKNATTYYQKGLADTYGAIPSTSGEPVRAQRLTEARQG